MTDARGRGDDPADGPEASAWFGTAAQYLTQGPGLRQVDRFVIEFKDVPKWSMLMAIYKRDDVFPEWEPIPWNVEEAVADEQEQGFHERALKPLVWRRIDWPNFPADGLFGEGKNWFMSRDACCVTSFEGENLVLIRNTWSGFPDPPEWGLASRREGSADAEWQVWGHFPNLPAAWSVPELD